MPESLRCDQNIVSPHRFPSGLCRRADASRDSRVILIEREYIDRTGKKRFEDYSSKGPSGTRCEATCNVP
jgi:hypothetical protein